MLLENPLSAKVRQLDRQAAADLFRIDGNTAGGRYLLLRRYVSGTPERFFARDVQREYLTWLQARHIADARGLRAYFVENMAEIERALLFLREVNLEDWHDSLIGSSGEWDFLRFIDARIHRIYLRLVEGVLAPLARVAAYHSRKDRSVGTDGLDIYAVVQELANSPLVLITRAYHHTLRNGIGHGGIIYRQNEVTYCDKRGNEATFGARDVVRMCDDLVDDCNGLAAALAVFTVQHQQDNYPVPEELLVQELREETAVPWWTIEGAIRSEVPAGRQLLVFARAGRQEFEKIQFSALHTGILSEALVSGYDRYFVSIRGHKGMGWAALNGNQLRAHRIANAEIDAYGSAVESVYYHPVRRWPRWLSRLDTLVQSLRINLPAGRREWHATRGIPEIRARYARLHRNGWRSVLNGAVVLERPDPETLRENLRRIVQCALDITTADTGATRLLPLGFAQVAVFCRDYRTRRLSGFGLGGDLVCTVRYQSIRRIRSPDILGSTVETRGPWRIAWNRAWLVREQVALSTPASWRSHAAADVI